MGQSIEKPVDPVDHDDWNGYNLDQLKAELSEYRRKLRDLSRLADLGQLSAGILHEIRNPVNFVNNFSRISQDLVLELKDLHDKPGNEWTAGDVADVEDIMGSLSGNLSKINENGKRIERIIQGMLGQLRGDSAVFVPTNLPQLIEEFSKLAYQSARADDKSFNVMLEYDFDPDVVEVNLVPNEFSRVVLNLVNNACYAIYERLKTAEAGYEPRLRLTTRKLGESVEIRFRDNGAGIKPEVLDRMFQAFFTTKPIGKGTGLGLSLTYSTIVETHKGTITADSRLSEYTEFTVTIPIK